MESQPRADETNGVSVAERKFGLLARGLGGDPVALGAFADEFTAEGVVWLPAMPHTASPYVGRSAIRKLLVDGVAEAYRAGLAIELYAVLQSHSAGPTRVAFQFEDRGWLRDGTPHAGSPVITLEMRGESISGFWEYRGGPGFFAEAGKATGADRVAQAAPRAVAEHAFACLQRGLAGDAGALNAFIERLAEDVRLWFPPTPNTRSPYVGRAAVERVFRDVIVPLYPSGLLVRRFHTLSGGHRTAFELQSHGVRRDGSEYLNSPMLTLEVRGEEIVRIWEHWGGPGFFDPEIRFDSIAGFGAATSDPA